MDKQENITKKYCFRESIPWCGHDGHEHTLARTHVNNYASYHENYEFTFLCPLAYRCRPITLRRLTSMLNYVRLRLCGLLLLNLQLCNYCRTTDQTWSGPNRMFCSILSTTMWTRLITCISTYDRHPFA